MAGPLRSTTTRNPPAGVGHHRRRRGIRHQKKHASHTSVHPQACQAGQGRAGQGRAGQGSAGHSTKLRRWSHSTTSGRPRPPPPPPPPRRPAPRTPGTCRQRARGRCPGAEGLRGGVGCGRVGRSSAQPLFGSIPIANLMPLPCAREKGRRQGRDTDSCMQAAAGSGYQRSCGTSGRPPPPCAGSLQAAGAARTSKAWFSWLGEARGTRCRCSGGGAAGSHSHRASSPPPEATGSHSHRASPRAPAAAAAPGTSRVLGVAHKLRGVGAPRGAHRHAPLLQLHQPAPHPLARLRGAGSGRAAACSAAGGARRVAPCSAL